MRIWLSNDDGYFAPGLAALAEALGQLGEVVVVAGSYGVRITEVVSAADRLRSMGA